MDEEQQKRIQEIEELVAILGTKREWACIAASETLRDSAKEMIPFLLERLRETERQFTRLRTDADQFRDLIRTLLDMPENAAPVVNWCEQHGEDISTLLPGGAWWEHDPADMLPKLDAGEIQEALAMYVLNVDRMEVRRMLEEWLKRNASTATVSSERGGAE